MAAAVKAAQQADPTFIKRPLMELNKEAVGLQKAGDLLGAVAAFGKLFERARCCWLTSTGQPLGIYHGITGISIDQACMMCHSLVRPPRSEQEYLALWLCPGSASMQLIQGKQDPSAHEVISHPITMRALCTVRNAYQAKLYAFRIDTQASSSGLMDQPAAGL